MASESFTGEQIRTFRQIFTELSDPAEGGLQFEAFAATVEACLQSAGLPPPPPHYLNAEFRRLSTTGTVPWQQFFQVRLLNLVDCSSHPIPYFHLKKCSTTNLTQLLLAQLRLVSCPQL